MAGKGGRAAQPKGATQLITTHPAHAVRGGLSLLVLPLGGFMVLAPLGALAFWGLADAFGLRWLGILLAGLGLYLAAAIYDHAAPRINWDRRRAAGTIAWLTGVFSWVMVEGPSPAWLGVTETTALVLGWWWFFVKTEAVRGFGGDAHPTDDRFRDELGLPSTTKASRVDEGDNHATTRLEHPDMTPGDVVKAVDRIAAKVGTSASLIRYLPGKHDGVSYLKFLREDVLKHPAGWDGPENPGGTVADGVCVGRYEHGLPMRVTVVGDPDAPQPKPAVPTMLVVGQTRAGKTQLALISLADLASRRDVVFVAADTAKGSQWIPLVAPLLQVTAVTLEGTRALIGGLARVRDYRVGSLTSIGLREWTPKAWDLLGIPEIYVLMEEAAQYAQELDDELTRNAETLGSVGIHVAFSLQRASHSTMPTDMRSQIPAAACFGVRDDTDAQMAVPDAIDAGAKPWAWTNKHPGKLYLEHPHVDPDLLGVPGRTWRIQEWQVVREAAAWAPLHEGRLDPGSVAALGDVWTNRGHVTVAEWSTSKRWGQSPYLRHPQVVPALEAAARGQLLDEVLVVKGRVERERQERVAGYLRADPFLGNVIPQQQTPVWGTPPPPRPAPAGEEVPVEVDELTLPDEIDPADPGLARDVAVVNDAIEARVTQEMGPAEEDDMDLPDDVEGLAAAAVALNAASDDGGGIDYTLPDDGYPPPTKEQRHANFQTLCRGLLADPARRQRDDVGERWYVDTDTDHLVDVWLDFPGERPELRPSLYRKLKAAEKAGHVRDLHWGTWRIFDTVLTAPLTDAELEPADDEDGDGDDMTDAEVEATLSDPALADT